MQPDGRYYDFERGGDYLSHVHFAQMTNETSTEDKSEITQPEKKSTDSKNKRTSEKEENELKTKDNKDLKNKLKDLNEPKKNSAIDPPNIYTPLTWGQRWKGMEPDGRYYKFEEPGDHHKKAPANQTLL